MKKYVIYVCLCLFEECAHEYVCVSLSVSAHVCMCVCTEREKRRETMTKSGIEIRHLFRSVVFYI